MKELMVKLVTTETINRYKRSEKVDGLNVEDTLSLYLVSNNLKDSANITLKSTDLAIYLGKNPNKSFIFNSDIQKFKSVLENLGVSYRLGALTYNPFKFKQQGKYEERLNMLIATNDRNLERLENARGVYETGIALGYPEESAKNFGRKINGTQIDGQYYFVELAKARKAGIEIPTWLAYIQFTPYEFDLVNSNVSESVIEIGEKYQNFVRENNPNLAEIVEEEFKDLGLPYSWKKTIFGSYELDYDTQFTVRN